MSGLFFIASIILLIVSFFFFDLIIKFQYKNYRNEWEKDGKPIGFFWIPKESTMFAGSLSRNIRSLALVFGNAEWMKNEPKILRMTMIMRICVFLFWILLFAFFIFLNTAK